MLKTLTVTGWVMDTQTLDFWHNANLSEHDVLIIFVDEFRQQDRQLLNITPQLLLIDFTPGVADTAFAWGFMQRIQVTGELQAVPTTGPVSSARATAARAQVVGIERNWTNRQLANQASVNLKRLAATFKQIRTSFVHRDSDFSTYQSLLIARAGHLARHQHRYLLNMLQQQRLAWAHLVAQEEPVVIRRTVLLNGKGRVVWRDAAKPKQDATKQQVTFTSPLPRINRRRLSSRRYRHELLAPLRRSARQWQRAGRPVDLPLPIPPYLAKNYVSWQAAFRQPTNSATAQ